MNKNKTACSNCSHLKREREKTKVIKELSAALKRTLKALQTAGEGR
jgi:hypothetical protein